MKTHPQPGCYLLWPITLVFIILLTSLQTAQAATVEISLGQAKHESLQGWNIYQLAYDASTQPDAGYIIDNYDQKYSYTGFSAAHERIPVLDRDWGLRIVDYPGYENTYWKVTMYLYVPGINAALGQKVYFVIASTSFDDSEGIPSNVVSVTTSWPGTPGKPQADNDDPDLKILFTLRPKQETDRVAAPLDALSIRLVD